MAINYLNWRKHDITQLDFDIKLDDFVVWTPCSHMHVGDEQQKWTRMWMFTEQWKIWIAIRCLWRGLLHKIMYWICGACCITIVIIICLNIWTIFVGLAEWKWLLRDDHNVLCIWMSLVSQCEYVIGLYLRRMEMVILWGLQLTFSCRFHNRLGIIKLLLISSFLRFFQPLLHFHFAIETMNLTVKMKQWNNDEFFKD